VSLKLALAFAIEVSIRLEVASMTGRGGGPQQLGGAFRSSVPSPRQREPKPGNRDSVLLGGQARQAQFKASLVTAA